MPHRLNIRRLNLYRRHIHPRRGGWLMFEVIGSLCLLGFLAGIMAYSGRREQINLKNLSDYRASVRAAEGALTALQTGRYHAAPDAGATISIQRLSEAAQLRMAWVTVRATVAGRASELIGVVPDEYLPPIAPREGGQP